MNKEQIVKMLKEGRDHYSSLIKKHRSDASDDLLISATGSFVALDNAIQKIEPRKKSLIRQELVDKVLGSGMTTDQIKEFWDSLKKKYPNDPSINKDK